MQVTAADKAPDGADGSLGASLRAAREARNLPVHQAAQGMRVGDEILAALERDDYSSLGAPIFVRGHLRNYARLLGISEDEVLAAYEHATSKLAPPPLITQRPSGSAFGHRVGLPVFSVLVIAVLVVLALIWWTYRSPEQTAVTPAQTHEAPATEAATVAPAALASMVSVTTDEPGHETPLKSATVVPGKSSRIVAKAAKSVPKATFAVQAAAIPSRTPVTVSESPVPPSQLTHVKFVVSQASWIEVYDAGGKRLFYDLAPAGDNLNVSGAGPLQVFLGYAPGVSIELNGKPFNKAPFTRSDNTARFKLGATGGNNGQAG